MSPTEIVFLRHPNTVVSEIRNCEAEIIVAVGADDCEALQRKVFYIQENDVEGFGRGHPVAIDDRRKHLTLVSRAVVQPEVVITKANSEWTLWEAASYFLQGLIGLRCARQVPCNDHRIRSAANDPSSQSL